MPTRLTCQLSDLLSDFLLGSFLF